MVGSPICTFPFVETSKQGSTLAKVVSMNSLTVADPSPQTQEAILTQAEVELGFGS